jgi:hypothetical protein
MTNNVFTDKQGIINIELVDQDPLAIGETWGKIEEAAHALRKKGKPVFLLYDLSRLEEIDTSTATAGIEFSNESDWDKLAVFGGNAVVKKMTRILIRASFAASRMRYPETREEAVRWLLEK